MASVNSNYAINTVNALSNTVPITPVAIQEVDNDHSFPIFAPVFAHFGLDSLIKYNARLNESERKMYVELLETLLIRTEDRDLRNLSRDISVARKLDVLLKNGKLLDRDSNDGSSTLENLYKMAKTPRFNSMNSTKLLCETISILYKPTVVTQNFGDVPFNYKNAIAKSPDVAPSVRNNPNLVDVNASSTCVAASLEFYLARKQPAEFARWAESLSSEKGSVEHTVKLSSLSENPMDAIWLLNEFELGPKKFSFTAPTFEFKPDKNAYKRALVQHDNWDPGERSIIDVLFQSTLMQIGSQQSYDSLTDMRGGKLSANPQGLVEYEKTFVESLLTNKEKFLVVYQDVSPEQYFVGYKTDFSVIDKHIKGALAEGEDVIVGYVTTNQQGKIDMGHEITIIDAKTDENGNTVYICNNTDDDTPGLVGYRADYLLPKIHHGGFSKHIVENELPYLDAA